MKNLNNYFILLILACFFVACEPEIDGKTELGGLPVASFDIIEGATPNQFTLVNTTPDIFISNWVVESIGSLEGETVDLQMDFMGEFEVSHTVFSQGGSDTATQTLIVTEDNGNSCFGNFEILTDCDEKIWKLAPEEGALFIGNDTQTHWQNSLADVDERSCHFNDEYIFRADGSFEYKSNGDFWADTDGGGNVTPADLGLSPGCHPSSAWPSQYSAWDSGMYSFTISDSALNVSGEGAFIGLYKVATNSEVTQPQSSISYEISEITSDRLIIRAVHGGDFWRFTLVSE